MAIKDFLTVPVTKKDDGVKRLYREVFSTRQGKEVLAHMLTELGFFNEIVFDQEQIANLNYARRLLKLMGVIQAKNVNKITDVLMSLPFEEE